MYSSLLAIAGEREDTQVYVKLMEGFGVVQRGEGDENFMRAWMLFRECDSPDIALYNTLLQLCARRGDVERSLELLGDIKDNKLECNERTYGTIMKCCFAAGEKGVARRIMEEAERSGEIGERTRAYWEQELMK